MTILELNKGAKLHMVDGALASLTPPQSLFGFTYHAHMIPPFKPATMLMMGYARGTVPDLVRLVWGNDIKVTAVERQQMENGKIEYQKFLMDARDYVKLCTDGDIKTRYDYIAIDIWDGTSIPDFIFEPKFVKCLAQMTKYMLCLNIPFTDMTYDKEHLDKDPRSMIYLANGFNYERHDRVDGNAVMWFSKTEE